MRHFVRPGDGKGTIGGYLSRGLQGTSQTGARHYAQFVGFSTEPVIIEQPR